MKKGSMSPELARKMLRDQEWSNPGETCPECGGKRQTKPAWMYGEPPGHKPDCLIASSLRKLENEKQ